MRYFLLAFTLPQKSFTLSLCIKDYISNIKTDKRYTSRDTFHRPILNVTSSLLLYPATVLLTPDNLDTVVQYKLLNYI